MFFKHNSSLICLSVSESIYGTVNLIKEMLHIVLKHGFNFETIA